MKAKVIMFRGRTVVAGIVQCTPCGKPVAVRQDHTMVPHGDCRGGNTSAHDGRIKAAA